MHASGLEHMRLCIDQYLRRDRHYRVLDFGARQVVEGHATHRRLLDGYDCEYVGADVTEGPNVDIVMPEPYRVPVRSSSVDVVMSAQVFEHIPFPWASFMEITRILRPGGLVFLIVPSRGHRHGTYDCWRFYPDSMRALAAFTRMELLESYVDMPPSHEGSKRLDYAAIDGQRSYWGDAVGVFRKPARFSLRARLTGELLTRWANKVGDLESVPRRARNPKRRRRRTAVSRATAGR